jgi:hypothetical protein
MRRLPSPCRSCGSRVGAESLTRACLSCGQRHAGPRQVVDVAAERELDRQLALWQFRLDVALAERNRERSKAHTVAFTESQERVRECRREVYIAKQKIHMHRAGGGQ